jgi:hypothetical protein
MKKTIVLLVLLLCLNLYGQKAVHNVEISSFPQGAKIYINGVDSGFTTLHTFQLNTGDCATISLEKQGFTYVPATYEITNIQDDISFGFESCDNYGHIPVFMRSVPTGANILIDGFDSGYITPHTVYMEPYTNAVYSVTKPGYTFNPVEFIVANATNETSQVFIAQELIPHNIEAPNPPNGATVKSWVFPFETELSWSAPSTGIMPSGYDVIWNESETPIDIGNSLTYQQNIPAIGNYNWKVSPYYMYVYQLPDWLGKGDGETEKVSKTEGLIPVQLATDQKEPPPPVNPSPENRARRRAEREEWMKWQYPQSCPEQCPKSAKVSFKEGSPPTDDDIVAILPVDTLSIISPLLEPGKTYFWKVVPFNSGGEAEDCEVWEFSTLSAPSPLSPANLAENISVYTPVLAWNAPEYYADSFFDVFLDTDPDFPNPPVYSGFGNIDPVNPDVRTCPAPAMTAETQYYFSVRYDCGSEGYWGTAVTTFTTGIYTPPPNAILWSPVNWETTVIPEMVKLGWIKPPGVHDSFFDVYFSTSPEFPDPPIYFGLGDHDYGEGSDHYKVEVPMLDDDQDYYWCVKLTDPRSGLSSTSDTWRFKTINAIIPGAPEMLIPPPGSGIPEVILTLDATSTSHVFYEMKPLSYFWDFGDAPEPPPNIINVPPTGGYIAKCTVTDSDGDLGLEAEVPPGTWWILTEYGGWWLRGMPYPYIGIVPGGVNLGPIPLGDKADKVFHILFVQGENMDPTLPVELSSFSATTSSNLFVDLQWIAQSETNHLGYNVLRSESSSLINSAQLNLQIIDTGIANGTEITYDFKDKETEPNNTYSYWLQSVALDGECSFYGPICVTLGNPGSPQTPPVIPTVTRLLDAYPNPFNPITYIPYSMQKSGEVRIDIYNNKGQLVRCLSNQHEKAGYYSVVWDGKDSNNTQVSSGVYFYRMTCGKYSAGKKIVLLK